MSSNTRQGVEKKTKLSRRMVNNAVHRLLVSKLLTLDKEATGEGRNHWLMLTRDGIEALENAGVKVRLAPRDFKVFSAARATVKSDLQERCEARSLMKLPPYEPKPDVPARAGALDFKDIQSKGIV